MKVFSFSKLPHLPFLWMEKQDKTDVPLLLDDVCFCLEVMFAIILWVTPPKGNAGICCLLENFFPQKGKFPSRRTTEFHLYKVFVNHVKLNFW